MAKGIKARLEITLRNRLAVSNTSSATFWMPAIFSWIFFFYFQLYDSHLILICSLWLFVITFLATLRLILILKKPALNAVIANYYQQEFANLFAKSLLPIENSTTYHIENYFDLIDNNDDFIANLKSISAEAMRDCTLQKRNDVSIVISYRNIISRASIVVFIVSMMIIIVMNPLIPTNSSLLSSVLWLPVFIAFTLYQADGLVRINKYFSDIFFDQLLSHIIIELSTPEEDV